MVKNAIFILFFILPFISLSQEIKKESFSVGFGKPWHPDIIDTHRNFNFSINFQNKFTKVFAYEIFAQYTVISSFPDFFENDKKLDNFIKNQEVIQAIGNTWWDEMKTFSFGGKIHYSFINNSKFFFSIYVGAGIYNSTSKTALLNILDSEPNQGMIREFYFTLPQENYTGFYYMPGIHFNYNIYKDFIVGIDLNLHRNFDNNKTDWLPVIPSFYGANFTIGKKF